MIDEKGIRVDERIVKIQMAYYYQHMDTEDLVMVGSIPDVENWCLLFGDLGLCALLSLYYAEGKMNENQSVLKNEMKEIGINKFFAHKVFTQVEVWRSAMPDDISKDKRSLKFW